MVVPVIVPVVSCAAAVPQNSAASSNISPSLSMRDLLRKASLPPSLRVGFATSRTATKARRHEAVLYKILLRALWLIRMSLRAQHDLAERAGFHHRLMGACRL